MQEDYIALVVVTGVALVAFFAIFNNLVKARLIEDTPTSKIRSASQGYVELNGFARLYEDHSLHAPLTGRPCLWYHYRIERYESNGKSSSWRMLESKTSDSFFTLQDDTGECLIDPRRADISTSHIKIWRGDSRRPLFPDAHSLSRLSPLSSGEYRYTEKIIQDSDYLYALGMFQSLHAPSPEQQTKAKMSEIINQWKQNYDQLVARFDSNGDGQLDMTEWEFARQQAAQQANDYVLDNYSDNSIHVMTYSPLPRKPYLISNQDPKMLSRKYRWQAAGMTLLFLIAAAASAYLAIDLFANSAVR